MDRTAPRRNVKVVEVANKADLDLAKRHFQLPYPPTVAKLERGPRDLAVKVTIQLSHLDLSDKYQARDSLDLDHIKSLRELDHLDPIEVFVLPNGRLVVTDGRHRIEVRKQHFGSSGHASIDAILWRGTDVNAQLRALEVNTKHGLSLSLDERRKAVTRYLKLRVDVTDVEIAAKLGLNAKTVKKIRTGLAAESSAAPTPAIRTDKNGHTRVVTGKREDPKAKTRAKARIHAARSLAPSEPLPAPNPAVVTPPVTTGPSAYDRATELVKSACKLMLGQPPDNVRAFITFTNHKLGELEANESQS